MSPGELLAAAEKLLREGAGLGRGLWSRAAATLIRQALEEHVRIVLVAHAPGAQAAPMRSQLLCLETLMPAERARALAYTWYRLSGALHQHAYELPPSAEELQAWLETVRDACGGLEQTTTTAAALTR